VEASNSCVRTFIFVFVSVFWLLWVSSLAYLTCLGLKGLVVVVETTKDQSTDYPIHQRNLS
jgi:hypothetical protein